LFVEGRKKKTYTFSKIINDDERDQFSRSLTGLIDLRNERSSVAEAPKVEASLLNESPEETAARLKVCCGCCGCLGLF
jgi:hypothetical protein